MTTASLQHLFAPPPDPALLHYGQYTPSLVALSVLVAIFSSYMALQTTAQAQAGRSRWLRAAMLASGSLALGFGVWAMHFIGMLAFDLCTSVAYDPVITLLSVLPSLAASGVALAIIARRRLQRWSLPVGGLLMGAGIGAMHYTGMASMQVALELRYDPWMFALSIVVAVALATLAIWIRFGLRGLRGPRLPRVARGLASACVMGCAIAGMHYTGMAAARFVGVIPPGQRYTTNTTFLALALTVITVAVTILVLAVNGLLRYRELFLQKSESEAGMRTLLTTTADAVITVDRQGTIEEFNAAAERMLGWAREDILGKNIRVLMGDVARAERDGLLHYLRHHGAPALAGREVTALRRDGSLLPIRYVLGHARLARREIFVLFVTDISERRAIMQALRDSEQQFRTLIGNIPGAAFRASTDFSQPPAFVSDGIARLTGYPASDFVGAAPARDYFELLAPADSATLRATIAASLGTGMPYQVEYRIQHADGSLRWALEYGAVTRDDANPERSWIDGVVLDISERHQMEQELRMAKERAEQAAAARASFLANMSHEIRTPMNSILGFTDVLLDSQLDEAQRRHLDTVRTQGRALLRLLNEVLDTAKLDKGALELEPDDYSLLALIDELASTHGGNARAKGLSIDIHYDPALPAALHGDQLRMRQILGNLLDNAIKFTASGGVTLRAWAAQGQLQLAVQDTGIGIAPGRLEAIFDPFTQADSSMARRYGGTGLGTTISRQLVGLMGGRIWAESVVGEGSTFRVSLPLQPARRAAMAATAPGQAYVLPPPGRGRPADAPQQLPPPARPEAVDALHPPRAPQPAPQAPAAGTDASPDLAAARQAGAQLISSLQRGALDDGAMEAMQASLAAAPGAGDAEQAAARAHALALSQIQRAIADFDFGLAEEKLQTLLNTLATDPP
ncbi:MHYT domain-containing protein [Oxalobacteraceae bacterium A2-2]